MPHINARGHLILAEDAKARLRVWKISLREKSFILSVGEKDMALSGDELEQLRKVLEVWKEATNWGEDEWDEDLYED